MKNKEILVITNYFPPEKGAASNRMFSLVNGLSEHDYQVKVVCPLPNYPQGKLFEGYKRKLFLKNKEPFGTLYRLWIWPSNSKNKFLRVLSMLSFSLSLTLFLLFHRIPQKVLIQYSPIFVGFTGVFWSSIFRKKIVLNISDLWPLAGLEMGILTKGWYYSLLTKMESFCYRKSHLILGQSKEILLHIKKRGITSPLFLYRNYPDFVPQIFTKKFLNADIKIVYAGLTGEAQGIYKICTSIDFPKYVSLHIFGTGSEAKQIKQLKKENIFYHGEIKREELHKKLIEFDVGLVPLTNRIYGSVPSKIFELSRVGLPIVYFAGGEGGKIVEDKMLGWVIPVNNLSALQSFITNLTPTMLTEYPNEKVQKNAINYFNFSDQMLRLVEKINSY